ncbi:MAG: hypothetical protein PHO08_05295 [Methylococcales bacterium]|nr:hypothetical protein [Methylococcales bacterium]MDD5632742.1 hypothetical protein [Methylococcales bacterium]
MSAPFGKNALTFSDVVKQLRTTFEAFRDRRTGKSTNYTMTDAGLSAFSVFFSAKPLFFGFSADDAGDARVRTRWTGKQHETDNYRYVSAVPLRCADEALAVKAVNWCEITISRAADGKVPYRNAFAMSLTVDDASVTEIIASGRARWKIENENNNTLKTKGYHFEHNFGHGQQFSSSLLATLVMLACLLHTLLDLMDDKIPASSNTSFAQTFVR